MSTEQPKYSWRDYAKWEKDLGAATATWKQFKDNPLTFIQKWEQTRAQDHYLTHLESRHQARMMFYAARLTAMRRACGDSNESYNTKIADSLNLHEPEIFPPFTTGHMSSDAQMAEMLTRASLLKNEFIHHYVTVISPQFTQDANDILDARFPFQANLIGGHRLDFTDSDRQIITATTQEAEAYIALARHLNVSSVDAVLSEYSLR